MANNIIITGSILSSNVINRYSANDLNLIPSTELPENFGAPGDYIEYYVYDAGRNLLSTNYNYSSFKLPPTTGFPPSVEVTSNTNNSIPSQGGIVSNFTSSNATYPIIEIDPVTDLQNLGYSSGEFTVQYNFLSNRISDPSAGLFIKEISADRTEIGVGSTVLTNDQLQQSVNNLISEYSSSAYYVDYLLNFGNNTQALAINTAINTSTSNYEIYFKLYQPLPTNVTPKTTLWVVKEIINPYSFDINLDKLIIPPPPPQLRGPNFDIQLKDHGTTTTSYENYNNLVVNNSSYNQLLSLTTTQSLDINVDYSNFSNFVFFGSAQARLNNFITKVEQIEDYNELISQYSLNSGSISSFQSEINNASSSISNLISNFDDFEYYLYFQSGSLTTTTQYGITPWPKSSSTLPYTLYNSTSSQVSNWYASASINATDWDTDNYNNLLYAVPSFITEDPNNSQYLLFLNMIGQYFDSIWVYLKAVTDVNLANNNLNDGISRDIVYTQLQSLGIDVHNSLGNQFLSNFLLGANTGSTTYTGTSSDDFSYTSSFLNNIPRKDLLAESYKRIYHNLPLLLKKKGTASGLSDLISTFGIPSRTYYTSGSNSFYVPTSNTTISSTTSSILNVKEFGGAKKSEILPGYNNDKVRIIQSSPYGNVLSPFISVVTADSASADFRTEDTHYVDISFSPQTQIDAYTSQLISNNYSTFNIDNYIGNPGQQYSSSYNDLTAFIAKNTPFTSSLLDYNGFIRLIQYFDNSLFKMLGDFVPARANLSTGVTFNSPILERNKVVYSNPSATELEPKYHGTITSSSFNADYGFLYNNLTGDKRAFYDGNITGSELDVYNEYILPNNFNPYLGNWAVYNSTQQPINQINSNSFYHSDYNVLLNNISGSRKSLIRQKLEFSGSFIAYVGSGSINILTSASLQDSYLNLASYLRSRYQGVKIKSAAYNTFTSGDSGSYGLTSAIDYYVDKIGLFTQIVSSSYFNYPSRNNVALKYLVDINGNLTELNQRNKNWVEVQNTFNSKNGDNIAISLFDNKLYSNQKTTDGSKTVFNSGYSYFPMLYYSNSDSQLYFQYTPQSTNVNTLFHFNNSNGYISGSTPLNYQITGGNIYQIFDTNNDPNTNEFQNGNSYYITGSNIKNTFPTFSVPQSGNYNFYADFGFNISYPTLNQSSSYQFNIVSGSTVLATQTINFTSSNNSYALSPPITIYYNNNTLQDTRNYTYPPGTYGTVQDLYTFITPNKINVIGLLGNITASIPSGAIVYAVTGSYYVKNYFQNIAQFDVIDNQYIYAYSSSTISFTTLPGSTDIRTPPTYTNITGPYGSINVPTIPSASTLYYAQTNYITSTTEHFSISTANTSYNYQSYPSGTQIAFQFIQLSQSTSSFTASLLTTGPSLTGGTYAGLYNSLQANQAGNNPYATSSASPFISGSGNTLVFNTSLSGFEGYLYLPNIGSNSLYSTYGLIDYNFNPKAGDEVIIYYNNGSQYFESTISNVYTSGSGASQQLYLTLYSQLPSLLQVSPYINSTITQLILLTQQQDETNLILTFNKRPGNTSYGFVIPSNINPTVLANIDTITSQVKQKLLINQQNTGITTS